MKLKELGDRILPWYSSLHDYDPVYNVASYFKSSSDPHPAMVQRAHRALNGLILHGEAHGPAKARLIETIDALESYMLCRGISLEKELL